MNVRSVTLCWYATQRCRWWVAWGGFVGHPVKGRDSIIRRDTKWATRLTSMSIHLSIDCEQWRQRHGSGQDSHQAYKEEERKKKKRSRVRQRSDGYNRDGEPHSIKTSQLLARTWESCPHVSEQTYRRHASCSWPHTSLWSMDTNRAYRSSVKHVYISKASRKMFMIRKRETPPGPQQSS